MQAKSAIRLLADEDLSPTRRQDSLRLASAAFIKLEYRIGDIRAFSDPSDLNLQHVSVGDLIDGAVEQVRAIYGHDKLSVEVDVPNALPPVKVDADPMRRALAHVIDNAVKFGQGKPVKVRARLCDGRVQIEIKDQGPGIPARLRPHLFRPFEVGDTRSTRAHGGMGIGLALVKMILDAHDAEIDIRSRSGKGTTVTLMLSQAHAPSA
jgi:signal transduction histidine kinase